MISKLETWKQMDELLKETKKREAELRRELCEELTDGYELTNGRSTTKGYDEESNLDFTAVQSLSYTMDKVVLEAIWSDLTDVEQDAVVWKPELGLAKYRKISDDSLLQDAVISKLAMPTLKVQIHE